jgi:hypothetical protein
MNPCQINTIINRLDRTPSSAIYLAGLIAYRIANYFHYGNSSNALGQIKTFAEERLRTHLMNRHKVKDRGAGGGRFPSKKLYEHYGLYKVPTTAGWKSAHASV